jgi:hypothetical protein
MLAGTPKGQHGAVMVGEPSLLVRRGCAQGQRVGQRNLRPRNMIGMSVGKSKELGSGL